MLTISHKYVSPKQYKNASLTPLMKEKLAPLSNKY